VGRRKNVGGFPFAALKYFRKVSPQQWAGLKDEDLVQNCFGEHPRITEAEVDGRVPDYGALLQGFRLHKASSLHNSKIGFTPHHLSHAYSIFPVMPFERALIVVSDGAGSEKSAFSTADLEWDFVEKNREEGREYFSVYAFENGKITPLEKFFSKQWFFTERKLRFSASFGSHFEYTAKLIFNNWTQAGKVMGLSAYGKSIEIKDMREYLLALNLEDFKIFKSKIEFDSQSEESFQRSANVAASIQHHFEVGMLKRMKELKEKYPQFDNVVLVGGCALNGLFNMKLVQSQLYKQVYVPPFPNDEGIALGCATKLAFERGDLKFKVAPIETINSYYGPIHNAVRAT